MTEKEKARKMYQSGMGIYEIVQVTHRQYNNVYRDCQDLIPQSTASINMAAFISEWNKATYPFLCLKLQRETRKGKKMIRFNQWRNISLQSLVDTLAKLDDEELQKIGFFRRSEDKRIEARRSELIQWLMEEI